MRHWASVAAFAALLVSELALGDLPFFGAVAGGVLAGVLAALLAEGPRDALAQALAASAAGLVALGLVTMLGTGVLPGAVEPPAAVKVVQAGLLAGLCPGVAWALARVAPVVWYAPRP